MGKTAARRIQKVGNASYSVVVPKSWINRCGIKPQDLITIEEMDDRLVIRPALTKPATANLSLDIFTSNEGLDLTTREVLSAYLDGCMLVNIKSRDGQLMPDFIQKLKQDVLELTIGLEVVDESRSGLTFQEIVSKPVMNFNGIVNRMYKITIEMLNMSIRAAIDLSTEDAESVIRADVDVDKFYLYGIRTLNLAVNDKSLLEEMGIERPEETLILKSILKSVERIADHAVSISRLVTSKFSFERFSEEMAMKAVKIFDRAFESLITLDEIKANSLILESRSYVEEMARAPYSMLTEHLVRIAEYSSDICENVIDLKVSRKIKREP